MESANPELTSGDEKLENENIEIELLLEALYQKYGYDFRNYAKASLKRRIQRRLLLSGLKNISEMQHKLLYDRSYFETLLFDFSINVTEMFRDPSFYLAVREKVLPILKTCSFIKIWHAGCSSGEEVYSMAILLIEEGLYDRSQIYATDFNDNALEKAQDRIFHLKDIQKYHQNYQDAGGVHSLTDYYLAQYDAAIFDPTLIEKVTFASHNLATDSVFGEMNLILCRNVLIYFDRALQNRVLTLLRDSLRHNGFLCLGSSETLEFSNVSQYFVGIAPKERIYQYKGSTVGLSPHGIEKKR